MTKEYGEIFANYIGIGVVDAKGREIGFAVVFRDNGTDFRAYVQNTRKVNGEWQEFGVKQRSKSFPSQTTANAWAYATAQVRRHKVCKSNNERIIQLTPEQYNQFERAMQWPEELAQWDKNNTPTNLGSLLGNFAAL